MTKYEELCKAFGQSSDDWNAYRDRSIFFVTRMLTGFVSYIGAPSDQVRFLPPEPRDDSSGMTYSPAGAAKLEKDGWWVAYTRLTLTVGEGMYPRVAALIKFCVRVEPDKFTVRLGDSTRFHTILDGDGNALEAVYQEACEVSKAYFTSGLQRFLDEIINNDSRKIGFV